MNDLQSNRLQSISNDLKAKSFAVVRNFFSKEEIAHLLTDFAQKRADGLFRPAGVGRGKSFKIDENLRRDEIYWLDEAQDSHSQPSWLGLEALRVHLNRTLFLGLSEFEAHYALYPPGGFYRRHLDRFTDNDRRILSVVIYLNCDWRPEFGGQLKMQIPGLASSQTIEPEAGTLVCFLSDQIEHEVVTSTRERMSIAAWMKRNSSGG